MTGRERAKWVRLLRSFRRRLLLLLQYAELTEFRTDTFCRRVGINNESDLLYSDGACSFPFHERQVHEIFLPFARSRSRAAASLSAGISFPSRDVMRLELSRLFQAAVGLSFSMLRGRVVFAGATFSFVSGLLVFCRPGLAGKGLTGTGVPVRTFGRSKIVSGSKRLDSSGAWVSGSLPPESLTGSSSGRVEALAGCSIDG